MLTLKQIILTLFILCCSLIAYAKIQKTRPPFKYQINAIPETIQEKMKQYTWRPTCPIALTDLAYLQLSFWGFDNKPHQGEMIVNKAVAREVVKIFKDLYNQRFPIERMQLMEDFEGDDNKAMAANNSSAFNCRANTTNPDRFSLHSYGRAIDVNSLLNPYVKGELVLPPHGKVYASRAKLQRGMFAVGTPAYLAFIKRGWRWGGAWKTRQDYQHFEKPGHEHAGGEQ